MAPHTLKINASNDASVFLVFSSSQTAIAPMWWEREWSLFLLLWLPRSNLFEKKIGGGEIWTLNLPSLYRCINPQDHGVLLRSKKFYIYGREISPPLLVSFTHQFLSHSNKLKMGFCIVRGAASSLCSFVCLSEPEVLSGTQPHPLK